MLTEEMSFQVLLENCQGFCQKGHDLSDVVQCNPQDRAVFTIWSLKVSWSSKITPRFLDGVIVEERSWMGKSCCRVGVAGKTRSSVFARLSCR